MSIAVLIVAAGSGSRMKGKIPKVYMDLAGKSIIRHTVEAFLRHPDIDRIQTVINPEHRPFYDEALAGIELPAPVAGGGTRQESVRNGLEALASHEPQFVLIHDAARPFVSRAVIDNIIDGLRLHKAVIPVIDVMDTLKVVYGLRVHETVDRNTVCRVQTPQGFHFETIMKAHKQFAGEDLTDDAAVCEKACVVVSVRDGEEKNIKITAPEDMQRAYEILRSLKGDTSMDGKEYDSVTGLGFDVHKLIPCTPATREWLNLCGVRIFGDFTLDGHSDADVGLHALVDALLGTIAEGDIGQHFPCDDPKWKGASSDQFVTHARELVSTKGGQIVHVDITLICEKPKISPHRDAMRKRISELLNIPLERVSVKATTTEKLGFTGREEGIAAQAVATVRLPIIT